MGESSTVRRDVELRKSLSKSRGWITALLVACFLIGPLALDEWSPQLIANTYGQDRQVFELMGFAGSLLLTGHVVLRLAGRRRSLLRLLVTLLPALVLLTFLNYLVEHSSKPWDYLCYENAAKAILANQDPYRVAEKAYLYPPLLAQTLAFNYRALGAAPFASQWPEEKRWKTLFVLMQSVQFLLLCGTYSLLVRWARACRIPIAQSVCLIAALLVFNTPLFRTLHHCQINLWILNSWLVGTIWAFKSPWIAGAAVAVGAHLKVYPALLGGLFVVTKRYAAAAVAALTVLVILMLLTSRGGDWTVWRQFIASPGPLEFFAYRNGSLFSVIPVTLYFLTGTRFWLGQPGTLAALIVSASILLWFVLRFVKRNSLARLAGGEKAQASVPAVEVFRGHAMDSILLSLIVSPIVWEHHYILALPPIVWGAAVASRERRLLIGLAAILILGFSSFDIFLLSYHRLAGVLLLTVLLAPGRVALPQA